jgi:hypothetical protein
MLTASDEKYEKTTPFNDSKTRPESNLHWQYEQRCVDEHFAATRRHSQLGCQFDDTSQENMKM